MPNFTNSQCTRENLAPNSTDEVWACLDRVIKRVKNLEESFVAQVRGDNAITFNINSDERNLITIWPQKNSLRINLRANGSKSLNRIHPPRSFNPAEFNLEWEKISNGIYEAFAKA